MLSFSKKILLILALLPFVSCGFKPSALKFNDKTFPTLGIALMQGQAPLNFETLQNHILKPKCMSCHSGEDAAPKLDPINFDTYETTMVSRFIPLLIKGKSEKSRLYQSVESGEMPIKGHLHHLEIKFIKDWIDTCAPKVLAEEDFSSCDTGGGDDDDGDFDDDDDFNNDDLIIIQ